jgi:hypothetical protein
MRASVGPMQLRIARGSLIALALLLPFEMPLFRVGPLQITTVELLLYAMLTAWGVTVATAVVRGRLTLPRAFAALQADRLAAAVVAWPVVLFVSAVDAPSNRAAALKFALRSLSGVFAFFAARALARPPDVARRVVLALVAGALVSAATATVDSWVPASASLWRLFREGEFDAFGLARASGVFAYPTMGAMYWEATVPLLAVAPFLGAQARSDFVARRRAGIAMLGGALLGEALLASATRSGLAGAAIACAALLGLVWRSGLWVRRAAMGILGVLAISSALPLAATRSGSLLGQRLHWWRDANWFGAEYVADTTPRTVHAGERFTVSVALRNTGEITWRCSGDRPTHLAYHWEPLGRSVTLADFEGRRTELSTDVPPGGALSVVANADAPATEGDYRLHWDVVQEDVTWFSERGNRMPAQPFEVIPALGEQPPVPSDEPPPAAGVPPPSRPALWRAAVVLWREHPLLGIGPDNFRRRYPAVIPPGASGLPYTDTRIHANSLYFETLADLGLAGIAALAWIVWTWALAVRRHHATGRLIGLGSGVAVGAFFVHGALDYFFEFTPLFGLFWVLLGLTSSGEREAP